jgi:hypothetical protein
MKAAARLGHGLAAAATMFPVVFLTAAPADAITVENGGAAQVDVNPGVTNPCTGAVGDLVDRERDSWTVVARSDGSSLVRGHSVARVTFTPYAGAEASYTGEEEFTDVETYSVGSTVLVAHRLRLRGTDGGTLTLVETVHLVIGLDGVVQRDRESFELSCDSRR